MFVAHQEIVLCMIKCHQVDNCFLPSAPQTIGARTGLPASVTIRARLDWAELGRQVKKWAVLVMASLQEDIASSRPDHPVLILTLSISNQANPKTGFRTGHYSTNNLVLPDCIALCLLHQCLSQYLTSHFMSQSLSKSISATLDLADSIPAPQHADS